MAEVRFFIHISRDKGDMCLALVSLFSKPDEYLLDISANTLWSCKYQNDGTLKFIDVKTIQSIVAMIPHRPEIPGLPLSECFFLVEKPGLDVAIMAGIEEDTPEDEGGTAECI